MSDPVCSGLQSPPWAAAPQVLLVEASDNGAT